MCGIAGFLGQTRFRNRHEFETMAVRMAQTLAHRGPDASGVWIDLDSNIALAHRRLSVLDLSPEGGQPMVSASGRFVVVFNGEIYNFKELRAELQPHRFRGSSDTEVMLSAFERWGVEDAVRRFNGMFAFAVWDRKQRLLCLGRDRLGEKPLYYTQTGGGFLFGSELKALRTHPGFRGSIDRGSLALFLCHGYVPAPYSIYSNVKKLAPGTLLVIDGKGKELAQIIYWSATDVVERGCASPLSVGEQEAEQRLEALLSDSVKRRMMSDVPLGAFLSGGIDSSLVVALMRQNSGRPVKTFTIGFHETRYDETEHAALVARHLGCEHAGLRVTPEDALDVIPRLPAVYDEPFADSSQIPTVLVSRLARSSVTVCLSGDGGDEVFGGYPRYLLAKRIWDEIGWLPQSSRRWLSAFLRQTIAADKVQKLACLLDAENRESLYLNLVSQWNDFPSTVLDAEKPPTLLTQRDEWPEVSDFVQTMMFLDSVTYLPDDILVKLDRASMGVGLETRVPLLDHRIFEFAWQLPLRMKVRGRRSKWLLRKVLHKYVPPALVDRPKTGFGIPIHEWLRRPLREWAEALLGGARLQREGFLNPEPIRRKWAEHLTGRRNWGFAIWNVLMFQAWLEAEGQRPWSTSSNEREVVLSHAGN